MKRNRIYQDDFSKKWFLYALKAATPIIIEFINKQRARQNQIEDVECEVIESKPPVKKVTN
jgi:hypothetical protein